MLYLLQLQRFLLSYLLIINFKETLKLFLFIIFLFIFIPDNRNNIPWYKHNFWYLRQFLLRVNRKCYFLCLNINLLFSLNTSIYYVFPGVFFFTCSIWRNCINTSLCASWINLSYIYISIYWFEKKCHFSKKQLAL